MRAWNKHGLTKHPLYSVYNMMKRRCYKNTCDVWKYYGGRGIRVCDRWLESFKYFLEDMGEKPSKDHSIDRIDNDGNYEPLNCRWATKAEQTNNRRLLNSLNSTYKHGTVNRYINMDCRCIECKKAISAYRKQSRLKKK